MQLKPGLKPVRLWRCLTVSHHLSRPPGTLPSRPNGGEGRGWGGIFCSGGSANRIVRAPDMIRL